MKNLSLSKLIQYELAGFVFLFPIFFLPGMADFFLLPKSLLALATATIMLITVVIYTIKSKEIVLVFKFLHWSILLFLLAFLVSLFGQSPNQVEAWISKGILLFSLATIYFITVNFLQKKHLSLIKNALVIVSTVLGILVIYQILGITDTSSSTFKWLNNKLWNPTGSPISLIVITICGATIALSNALRKSTSVVKAGVLLFLVLIQGVAAATVISEILPGKGNTIAQLPYAYGYSIAIDTLKNWRTALFGVGPGNYLSAFTRFKPVGYNSLETLWNIRFTSSSSELLQIMTTMGLLGLIAWVWMAYLLAKNSVILFKNYVVEAILTIILIITLLLVGANSTILSLFFLILIINGVLTEKAQIKEIRTFPQITMSIVVVGFILVAGWYYAGKYALAEAYFRSSLNALVTNNAVDTYNFQIKTIKTNPYRARYRIAYSRTNLALATGLAAQKNLKEEDTKRIVPLIQQSVREAKAAVRLNPQNVNAWENLANTYRQLINFANGAKGFALQSYSQALNLDPRNPRLWVDYGGLLLSTKQADAATAAFRQAVVLKRDYANAHFNLANAYKAEKKYIQAYKSMQAVLALVSPDSNDYATASKAMEELKKMIQKSQPVTKPSQPKVLTPEEKSTLTTPSPAPEKPKDLEVIELPKDATPEDLVSPTPSPALDGTASNI